MATIVADIERERFHIPIGSLSFKSQFTGVYLSRLRIARSILESKVQNRWKNQPPMRSLADLTYSEDCVIIGTLVKETDGRPSVIKQLAELDMIGSEDDYDEAGSAISTLQRRENRNFNRVAGEGDALFLEDEVQRIKLVAADDKAGGIQERLVTGVVVALRGFENEFSPGTFTVTDAIFPEPQPEQTIATTTVGRPALGSAPFNLGGGQWVAFVSGLGFTGSGLNHHADSHALSLRLLADWLRAGKEGPVKRLFILGDSIQSGDSGSSELLQQARFLTRKADADSVTAMAAFDTWLSQLPLGGQATGDSEGGSGLRVDILPGPSDCVSQLLPQQPLHPVLLPKAVAMAGGRSSGGLRSSTNPCLARVGGRRVLATSGQTVTDVYRYTQAGDVLDCMESMLRWGHLAPTCPDTLYGYPLADRDPLLLTSSDYPDVFVAGNQSQAVWRRARLSVEKQGHAMEAEEEEEEQKGALLVSIPRFDKTQTLVLLELDSLRCLPLRFDLSAL